MNALELHGLHKRFGLTEVIRERQHASASEILAAIDRAVQEFSQGTRQADDTTAVVIKRI